MKRYNILYVDDEDTNLRVFNSIFRRFYKVFTASSGEAGLEILRQQPVQAIITDQRMPNMTGLEFLGEARKVCPDAIRIVLTAYSDADTTIKGINEFGIYRYLIKPWVKTEMRLTLDKALETWQLRQDKKGLIEKLKTANQSLETKVEERTQNLLATNRALEQANEKLEEASASREQFMNMISHEMRNPLNVIVQSAHLLKTDLPAKQRKQQLEVLSFSADTLLALISDLLDAAKLEAGKLEFEHITFDPTHVLKKIRESFVAKVKAKNIELDLSLPNHLGVKLIGDPLRLNQIVTNLVSNAIKFTPEHGNVRIIAESTELEGDKVRLRVSVKDTGIGIPEERLSSIFDSYTQAASDTTRKYGGTGLGLSTTKNLVELQGGKISVKSKVDEGSCFSFELDFGKETQSFVEQVSENTHSELEGLNLLLVDDDRLNHLVTQRILTLWGVSVVSAYDGKEALEQLEAGHNFDLVLMDVYMPEMDGKTTVRRIRDHKKVSLRKLKVIALTGEADDSLLAFGFSDWIKKPYQPEALAEKLRLHTSEVSTFKQPSFSNLKELAQNDQVFIRKSLTLFQQQLSELEDVLKQKNTTELRFALDKSKGSFQLFRLQGAQEVLASASKEAEEYVHVIRKSVKEELEKVET